MRIKMKSNNPFFDTELLKVAFKQAFIKLNPKEMLRNPVMFTVEVCTVVMAVVCIAILMGDKTQGSFAYNFIVFLILFVTLLFANFAESLAEARGKAQADSLRKKIGRASC